MSEEAVSGKRTRRPTKLNVDYQFNYESSEEERAITEEKRRRASTKSVKRTKECPGCGTVVSVSVRECRLCDYQFTSKSLGSAALTAQQQESQSIRDRFPFEPEKEEDGTYAIQTILGRRVRKSGNRIQKTTESSVSLADMTAMDAKYEYEYLIKFKGLSYLRVQWLSATDIETMNTRSRNMLNKYLTKIDRGEPVDLD